MREIILELKQVTKEFPGVRALDGVSFSIGRGDVHAIVGENGAGKSTLIKILAGIYKLDAGSVLLEGAEVTFRSPHMSQQMGISVVHQELKLSETLSVVENVFLGHLLYKHGLVDWKAMERRASELLHSLGIDIDLYMPVEKLSVAQKQMVEIAKAINNRCKILILDEPSATLTKHEQALMYSVVRKMREIGITIIYISHRLEEIFDLANMVTVLRDGKHVDTCTIEEVDRTKLISMMVGRTVNQEYPHVDYPVQEPVLEVRNLSVRGVLHDISFTAHRGEVLGIAGLVGAGRTELVHTILGILHADSGEIVYKGTPIDLKKHNWKKAVAMGFGLVPEDRKKQGLIQIASVKNNVSMVNIQSVLSNGWISAKKEDAVAHKYVNQLGIRTSSIETEVQYLSGGNQQKVAIAKWLLANSDVIFLDEPTRGIDVGAKSEIYNLIVDLVKQGKVVIIISSELPEVIGLSDRILVMHGGESRGIIARNEASQEGILAMCV